MKSYDYEAVTFDGGVYCIECLEPAPPVCPRCKTPAIVRAGDPEWFDGMYCGNPACVNFERDLDEREAMTSRDGVYPIFADSEWDSAPVCDACGAVHDYVNVLASDDDDDELDEDCDDLEEEIG